MNDKTRRKLRRSANQRRRGAMCQLCRTAAGEAVEILLNESGPVVGELTICRACSATGDVAKLGELAHDALHGRTRR